MGTVDLTFLAKQIELRRARLEQTARELAEIRALIRSDAALLQRVDKFASALNSDLAFILNAQRERQRLACHGTADTLRANAPGAFSQDAE